MLPEERETVILYNDGSDIANIYTHDKALQAHIQKVLGIKPERTEGSAKYYLIPKKWIRWPRKPSEKRMEAGRQRFKKLGDAHPLKSSKRSQKA